MEDCCAEKMSQCLADGSVVDHHSSIPGQGLNPSGGRAGGRDQ